MDWILVGLTGASLAIWLVLLFARGGFWLARERLDETALDRQAWPAVVAIVPARDEADVIGRTMRSVLGQDYPGPLSVILVDDHSRDGTAAIARQAGARSGRPEALDVITSRALPSDWTGKLWAMSEGLRHAAGRAPHAPFVWFTDADIEHDPQSLRRLVDKAEREGRDLVSVMVLLACESPWDRLLIPPFVFFFAMLYPFAWVNEPRRRMAAAAGGCVLVRRAALDLAGGLAPIRAEIIDDCALARRIKHHGREGGAGSIWLGLTEKLRSVRPYQGFRGVWSMVARSAYTQLGRSPLMLVLTLIGMIVVYLVPPLAFFAYPWHGNGFAAGLGASTWLLMAVAIWPTLRLYRQPILLAPFLPVAALFYCAMTIGSGIAHARGRGGAWKGRVQSMATGEGRRS